MRRRWEELQRSRDARSFADKMDNFETQTLMAYDPRLKLKPWS
jgi:hypothetical protein